MSSWDGMAPSLCVWGYSCVMTSAGVANAKDLIGASPSIEIDYSNYQCGLLHSESLQHDGLFLAPKKHPVAYVPT
jgi:hypothetical protein